MTQLEPTVLPVTVAAAHLEACAGELASGGDLELGELAVVLDHTVTAQRALAETVAGLAERARQAGESGALAAAPSAEVDALGAILQAAAATFDCSADALAEGAPMVRTIGESAGSNTRL